MTEFALASFVAFLVTMNPAETAAVFSALTRTTPRYEQKRIAVKGTLVAAVLVSVFALVGDDLLRIIGISLAGVQVGGGILLMLVSIELVFGHPGGSATPSGEHESPHSDIAVFPLATPIIVGPAAITAVVVKASEARNHLVPTLIVFAALAAVMLMTWVAMLGSGFMQRWIGHTGMNVVTRILGILLAALAAELVLTGMRESGVFG